VIKDYVNILTLQNLYQWNLEFWVFSRRVAIDAKRRESPRGLRWSSATASRGWVAMLTPLSVDGMIVVASTTLLATRAQAGRAGPPWTLLIIGSVASTAAVSLWPSTP